MLQIWDKGLDFPLTKPRSKDIPCNVLSHLLLRKRRLEWLQVMRSNDLVWGLPYNLIQWTYLQEVVAGWLGVEPGQYVHVSDSLHAYNRHWKALPDWSNTGRRASNFPLARIGITGYDQWEQVFTKVVDLALGITAGQDPRDLIEIRDAASYLPLAYREWISLLSAEALRRAGCIEDAEALIPEAGRCWASSWRQWAAFRAATAEKRRLRGQSLAEAPSPCT